MNISKHVTLQEFTHSDSAIRYGISNEMNSTQLACAKLVCEKVFEPLREWLGKPIKINSGFRSFAVNKRIGGSKTSQHMKGEAIDLNIGSKEFHYIKDNLEFDQLIWEFGNDIEPQWVHVSYTSGNNKRQVLRAKKVKGKTIYSQF